MSARRDVRRAFAAAFLLPFLVENTLAAGTTSAAFLRLGSGARSAAMANAFTANADDATATYWNPAGMSRLPSRELMAEHVIHIQDIAVNRVAYVQPLGAPGASVRKAIGVSATHLSVGGLEARTGNTPEPDRNFDASDFYAAVSYAHPVNGRMGLGLTGKFIRQQIDTYQASTFAADLGFLYRLGRYQLGATLANLGPAMRFVDRSFPLPRSLRTGVSVDLAPVALLRLSVEAEALAGEPTPSFKMGAEYGMGGTLALRGGYLLRTPATRNALTGGSLGTGSGGGGGSLVGLVGGIGLGIAGYRLDYAITPFGSLGNSHQMSFSARF